jgi:hypothetical protein
MLLSAVLIIVALLLMRHFNASLRECDKYLLESPRATHGLIACGFHAGNRRRVNASESSWRSQARLSQ